MSSSDVIVAINNDPNAPLMKLATFALEGNLYEIIPAIIREVKKLKGEPVDETRLKQLAAIGGVNLKN